PAGRGGPGADGDRRGILRTGAGDRAPSRARRLPRGPRHPGRRVLGRTVASPDERERLTWEEFGDAARELARLVIGSGFEPTVLLAIARGGLPVGGAVSYALGLKNCCAINVEYYTGVDERLDVPVILPPALNFVDLSDA